MLKVLFAIKNNVQGAMQYIFQLVSKHCGRGLPSAVACVSEHAVIQHFFCHFINVLEIEKKHFQWLPIHINKTF